MKTKKAFTLAEVLITLVIIGVIAALTIPTLMHNTQHKELVVALKKAYSGLSQSIIRIASDNYCVGDLKCTQLFNSDKTNKDVGDEIIKYFSIQKNCEAASGCFSNSVANGYDGSGGRDDYSTWGYSFVTSDGMAFTLSSGKDGCSDGGNGPVSQLCGDILVDVNGTGKGPNNFGRDIFYFHITNGKGPLIYPGGGADSSIGPWKGPDGTIYNCDDNGTDPEGYGPKAGVFCAGRIMDEAWDMNY